MVAHRAAAREGDLVSVVVGGVSLDAELCSGVQDSVLPWSHPLPAQFDDLPVAEVVVECAAADAVTRFDDEVVGAGVAEFIRGGEAGKSGSNDYDVGVAILLTSVSRYCFWVGRCSVGMIALSERVSG